MASESRKVLKFSIDYLSILPIDRQTASLRKSAAYARSADQCSCADFGRESVRSKTSLSTCKEMGRCGFQ